MTEVARRATLRDVAETAGVSRSTASRALSGRGYVAEPVRKKVLHTAEKLGYVPDVMARNLKQQVSRSIGILVTDLRNQFYADLAAGASQQARASGYTTMLVDDGLSSAADDATIAEAFVALRVGGVILTPTSAAVPEYLTRHQVPIVEVDRQFMPGRSDGVLVDNVAGARAATEHLLALGHRRIALFSDETDWTTGKGRYDGYVAALGAAGVDVDPGLVVATGWNVEDSRARARQLLGGSDRPTAVFAANNVLAEGVWRAIADVGLSVPEEVSLVAFDDAPWMSMVTPGVTAVAQDSVELGAAAVRRLLARLADVDDPPGATVLDVTLRTRGSTHHA